MSKSVYSQRPLTALHEDDPRQFQRFLTDIFTAEEKGVPMAKVRRDWSVKLYGKKSDGSPKKELSPSNTEWILDGRGWTPDVIALRKKLGQKAPKQLITAAALGTKRLAEKAKAKEERKAKSASKKKKTPSKKKVKTSDRLEKAMARKEKHKTKKPAAAAPKAATKSPTAKKHAEKAAAAKKLRVVKTEKKESSAA